MAFSITTLSTPQTTHTNHENVQLFTTPQKITAIIDVALIAIAAAAAIAILLASTGAVDLGPLNSIATTVNSHGAYAIICFAGAVLIADITTLVRTALKRINELKEIANANSTSSLTTALSEANNAKLRIEGELKAEQARVTALNAELQTLKAAAPETITVQDPKTVQDLAEKTAEITALRAQVNKLQERIKELEESSDAESSSEESPKTPKTPRHPPTEGFPLSPIDEKSTEGSLPSSPSPIHAELVEMKRQLDEKKKELQEYVENFTENELKPLAQQKANLEKEIEQLTNNKIPLEKSAEKVRQDIAARRTELEALNQEIAQMEKNKEDLSTIIAGINFQRVSQGLDPNYDDLGNLKDSGSPSPGQSQEIATATTLPLPKGPPLDMDIESHSEPTPESPKSTDSEKHHERSNSSPGSLTPTHVVPEVKINHDANAELIEKITTYTIDNDAYSLESLRFNTMSTEQRNAVLKLLGHRFQIPLNTLMKSMRDAKTNIAAARSISEVDGGFRKLDEAVAALKGHLEKIKDAQGQPNIPPIKFFFGVEVEPKQKALPEGHIVLGTVHKEEKVEDVAEANQ